MIYKQFQDLKLSNLGFGAMRLPLLADKSIDEKLTFEMVDEAIEHGVNYFDTAFSYMNAKSEIVLGKALARHPRESFYLSTKFPGHEIAETYDPKAVFEKQLKKCGVDYFDFYLLHNVNEASLSVYENPQWGIIDYFKQMKQEGKIRHLGFSAHFQPENLEAFLQKHAVDMEFCLIQLNYLDYTLQNAKEKVAILNKYQIPIWVMEPVRGGKLVNIGEENQKKLEKSRPGESTASWAFRFLQQIPGVTVILSGMSDMNQMKDNIRTFEKENPLSEQEVGMLLSIAENLKNEVPCTSCRYCCKECPMDLDIPALIRLYNDYKYAQGVNIQIRLSALPEDKRPSACIGCSNCKTVCPQKIDVSGIMEDFASRIQAAPTWEQICKERAAAAKALEE